MKLILIITSLFVLSSVQLFTQTSSSSVTKFDPGKDPAKDLQTAIIEAQKTNKNILLDVGGEWCIWCHRIDAFIEGHEDINTFMQNNFVVMKVNYSRENKNEDFLSKYPEIPGYPHFFVLDQDGNFLHSQDTGKLEEGKDYNPEKFMAFLEEWRPKKN